MRVLICGSRDFEDFLAVDTYIENLPPLSTIIAGGARGVDTWAENAGKRFGHRVVVYPANWAKYGKVAGFIRNKQMIEEGKPDKVVAFWDGKSKGTKSTIDLAMQAKIPTEVIYATRSDRTTL